MKAKVEKIQFYPYRKVIVNNSEYRIERYNVVEKQWVLLPDIYTDETTCQSTIDEFNMESGLIYESYIVEYLND